MGQKLAHVLLLFKLVGEEQFSPQKTACGVRHDNTWKNETGVVYEWRKCVTKIEQMGEGANRAKKTKTDLGPIQIILLTKRYKDSETKVRHRTTRSRLEKPCSISFRIINNMGITLHSRRIPHQFSEGLFRNALQRQVCGIAMSENMRRNSRR